MWTTGFKYSWREIEQTVDKAGWRKCAVSYADKWAPNDFAAKNAIFRSLKSANFVKDFAKNPEFC